MSQRSYPALAAAPRPSGRCSAASRCASRSPTTTPSASRRSARRIVVSHRQSEVRRAGASGRSAQARPADVDDGGRPVIVARLDPSRRGRDAGRDATARCAGSFRVCSPSSCRGIPNAATASRASSRPSGLPSDAALARGAADSDTDIYVADTIGELGLFYRLAPIVFMGGSLVDAWRAESDRGDQAWRGHRARPACL